MAICWERACAIILYASLTACVPFPFGVWYRMCISIISVPDHCLFSTLLSSGIRIHSKCLWGYALLCLDHLNVNYDMSLVTRNPVFGVCHQGRLKPVCADKSDAQADLRLCCSHMAHDEAHIVLWLLQVCTQSFASYSLNCSDFNQICASDLVRLLISHCNSIRLSLITAHAYWLYVF